MSNDPTPEGWTDEQWAEYLASAYDESDDQVEFVTMNVVEVPEIQAQGDTTA